MTFKTKKKVIPFGREGIHSLSWKLINNGKEISIYPVLPLQMTPLGNQIGSDFTKTFIINENKRMHLQVHHFATLNELNDY